MSTRTKDKGKNAGAPAEAAEAPSIDDVLGAIDAVAQQGGVDAPSGEDAGADFAFSEEALAAQPEAAAPVDDAVPQPVAESRSKSQFLPLTPEKAIELLARVNIFSGLPAPFLRRIASICEEERHETGATVFKEGQAGDKLYLIFSGAVRISRNVPGMGEEALAVLKAGDYFGEMALIDDFPRSADALAHEDCRLVAIGKDKLQDLLFVDRDLAYDLLWTFVRTLSARLRQTNDKMTFMAVTSKF